MSPCRFFYVTQRFIDDVQRQATARRYRCGQRAGGVYDQMASADVETDAAAHDPSWSPIHV